MGKVILISGSPSISSRTTGVLDYAERLVREAGHTAQWIHVRELPAEDLLHAKFDSPAILEANRLVEEADAVILATPVYKASYTGVLKAFLDLLPQKGLAGKIVLPLAVGGTIAHLLAIDYALKPVLSALGSPTLLGGVFLLDSQIQRTEDGFELNGEIAARLKEALSEFNSEVHWHTRKYSAAERRGSSVG
ncbi:NADPH-dependent FMN reductase [Paenibacillus aurantius]|uniref:NADPH-dependent FMN reductase n=1 Tax=Paenibacillus aurantius TaxID=2918900 RepID=A0AA96RJ40_9BACL|nr:NADPH-dependent FMN reductase [Paenibacillus aurantius]WNQ12839.1 NADPH-dependent FMN reductase [Paenibacillus aurantius]